MAPRADRLLPAPSPARPDPLRTRTVSTLTAIYAVKGYTVSPLCIYAMHKGYTVACVTPSVPVVRRASTYSTSRRADSSGDSDSVSSTSSAASGSS
jgi:hypothetical protein